MQAQPLTDSKKSDKREIISYHQTISVIIPAYNAEKYLAKAIESAVNQTRPPDEIIVIDDGSTDGTGAVVARYGERVRYVRQANAGPASARNTGVTAARGNWIAFLDADDVWFPFKLEQQLQAISKINTPALWGGRTISFTGDMIPVATASSEEQIVRPTFEQFLQRNQIGTSTVLVPRQQLLDVGGFHTQWRGPEDYDLWLRLVASGLPVCKSSAYLSAYRITPHSLSQQIEKMRNQELLIINQYPSAAKLARRAKAGVYLRAAIAFAECKSVAQALDELKKSWREWRFRLPEYSKSQIFPRLRLWLCLQRMRRRN